jgi:hypothetical protein
LFTKINNKNKSLVSINKSNSFFQNLFNDLKFIIKNNRNNKNNKNKINKNIILKKINDTSSKYLVDSDFTSKNINNYILKYLIYCYEFKYNNITIIYFTRKNLIIRDNIGNNVPKIITKMFFTIEIMQKLFKREDKAQKLIFFETNKKKQFPKKVKALEANNVNTAFTFIDSEHLNGDIILYRKEEAIKVLIHELLHSNCIDHKIIYSEKSKQFSNLFCSNYKVLLNECFTETMACIINIFIIFIVKNNNKKQELEKMFKNEYMYSNYICSKIKTFYNIKKISNIIKINNCVEHFPQLTNVLSYYFLKNILLKNINKFDILMTKYSKDYKITNENFITDLIKLIINNIEELDSCLLTIKDNNNKLKMSYYEMK